MIEATLIFRDGIHTQLTLNVTFEDVFKTGIETFSQMGLTEYDSLNDKIPEYMHILGRILKERAEGFLDGENGDKNKIVDSKIWTLKEEERKYKEINK